MVMIDYFNLVNNLNNYVNYYFIIIIVPEKPLWGGSIKYACMYVIVAPLHHLTHKGVGFKWQEVHQQALDELKPSLTSDDVMAYFDPCKRTVLMVVPVQLD